jgi:putative hydrolase
LRIEVDTHTHTVSSGHAYSTVQEIAEQARLKGLKMFAVTDHGPSMNGAPHLWHFGNMRVIPREINGVRVLKGVEANIVSYDGSLDMPDEYLRRLDCVMASFHDVCIPPATDREHTGALVNVLRNPLVDAIAHSGNAQFEIDKEVFVKAAAEYGKLIEINNHSFTVRRGSEANCRDIALLCKRYGVRIVCGSDAHISFDVGKFDKVEQLLEEIGMPEELVLNASMEKFEDYLLNRKR